MIKWDGKIILIYEYIILYIKKNARHVEKMEIEFLRTRQKTAIIVEEGNK